VGVAAVADGLEVEACCLLFIVVARVRRGWSWYAVMLFNLMELLVLLVEGGSGYSWPAGGSVVVVSNRCIPRPGTL